MAVITGVIVFSAVSEVEETLTASPGASGGFARAESLLATALAFAF